MSSRYLTALVLAGAVGSGVGIVRAGDSIATGTDWMELVKGYKDKKTGAELRDIQEGDAGGRKITIAIPKSAIDAPGTLEEVRVVGHRPERMKLEFPLEIRHEWVEDYDNDYYGLVVYLGKDTTVPIRLYMESKTGFINDGGPSR
ncbi:MAG: hypothetical protein ACK5HY_05945 [Parahaliea sp.]